MPLPQRESSVNKKNVKYTLLEISSGFKNLKTEILYLFLSFFFQIYIGSTPVYEDSSLKKSHHHILSSYKADRQRFWQFYSGGTNKRSMQFKFLCKAIDLSDVCGCVANLERSVVRLIEFSDNSLFVETSSNILVIIAIEKRCDVRVCP